MNLLLLRYSRYRLALDMRRVARVLPRDEVPPLRDPEATHGSTIQGDPRWLLDPGPARMAVVLTSGRILPASEIETTSDFPEPLVPANPFLRGCCRSSLVDGFAIVSGRVYGVLSDPFLTDARQP